MTNPVTQDDIEILEAYITRKKISDPQYYTSGKLDRDERQLRALKRLLAEQRQEAAQ